MKLLSRLAAPLFLLALVLACFPGQAQAADSFKTVGYFPYWQPGQVHKIQYDKLTHINYAFVIPTEDGGLLPLENPSLARQIIRDAHQEGVQVLLAVGGWSYQNIPLESTFASATATRAKRQAFAQAIVEMCLEYGFDGVDIDWEYPRISDGTYRQYEAFMLDLSQRLDKHGKLLTIAVQAGVSPTGTVYRDSAAHTDAVLEAVDWINIMAYDGGEGERHSPYDFAVHAARYWREKRGLPAEKVVLGVPFFGRAPYVTYDALLAADPDAWSKDSTLYKGQTIWYNGLPTISQKTQYALEHLGGVMIWELSQDTADEDLSLLTAIHSTVQAEQMPFLDVPAGSWFEQGVLAARDAGLMRGTGGGYFSPLRTVTGVEGISLAARIHRIHTAGTDDLISDEPWYQAYVDYALDHGILENKPHTGQLEGVLTRAEFAALLASSLPEEALPVLNEVDAIPDVAHDHPQAQAIYLLYRAGVLQGTDAQGTFSPDGTLTRAQAAVIVTRMTDPALRVVFQTA